MSESPVLRREHEALAFLDTIGDPGVRELVELVVAEAKLMCIRPAGQNEAEWQSGLPEGGIDMLFLSRLLSRALSNKSLVTATLQGQRLRSVEEGGLSGLH